MTRDADYARVRKFDGKGYIATTTHKTKTRAKQSANQDKRSDTRYRIIKEGKIYVVYIRRSKK